jgi:plastocyanin
MKITEQPAANATALTVQRAANQTQAGAHSAGAHLYNTPAPPDPLSINRTACGQAPPALGPEVPAPGPNEVNVVNFQYQPKDKPVRVGDRITWKNYDTAPHTVTSATNDTYPRRPIDSGLFGQDQTFSYTFEVAGTFNYFCTVHPYMTGSIAVQQ